MFWIGIVQCIHLSTRQIFDVYIAAVFPEEGLRRFGLLGVRPARRHYTPIR